MHTLTVPPGQSRSVLHFVVLGPRVPAATSAVERAAVEARASGIVAALPVGGLTAAEVCPIANFSAAALAAAGFDRSVCKTRGWQSSPGHRCHQRPSRSRAPATTSWR